MTIGIISGGTADRELLTKWKEKADLWIAADHGADAAAACGIVPGEILGDFDSADPAVLKAFHEDPGVKWEVHPSEKDETDTELALMTAISRIQASGEPGRILLFAATGTRLDHTIANIHILLRAFQAGIPCEILDAHNRITLVDGFACFKRSELYGENVSFLPLGGEVKHVTLEGFYYPLKDAVIRPGMALTVSNKLAGEYASLSCEGTLICFETKDR